MAKLATDKAIERENVSGRIFASLARVCIYLTRDRLTFFATMWALATLFHVVGQPGSLYSLRNGFADFTSPATISQAALVIAAVYVLVRPGNSFRLFMLSAVQVIDYLVKAPIGSNHWTVAFFASAGVVLAAALLFSPNSKFSTLSEEYYDYFAPVGRYILLIMYMYGIFHKINADFLNPSVSCAVLLYGLLAAPLGLSDALWAHYAAIHGTFLVEACAIICLAVPSLRYFGFAIGLPFHIAIAISGQAVVPYGVGGTYFDFSTVVFALYALFLPAPFFARLKRVCAEPRIFIPAISVVAAVILTGFILLIILFQTGYMEMDRPTTVLFPAVAVVAFVYGCTFWLAVLTLTRPKDFKEERGFLRFRHAALVPIVALFFLNGMSPYLGFKTEYSMAMFSNLHTEGAETNHLLFKEPPYLFDYQRNLIEIVESSDESLQKYIDWGHLMVEHEFWRHLRHNPEISVTYRLDGKTYTLKRAYDHPKVQAGASWLEKVLLFKPVDLARPKVCSH